MLIAEMVHAHLGQPSLIDDQSQSNQRESMDGPVSTAASR